MKTLKSAKCAIFYFILLALTGVIACKRDESLGNAPRLFRPTIKGEILTDSNTVKVSWQKIKEASNYTLQLSRDTFKTIDVSIDLDSNAAIVEDLKWDQLYQIQIRANAPDSAKNSKFGYLGATKTPRFPTILLPATINDVTEASAIVRWTASGNPVTELRVLSGPAGTLIQTVSLTDADRSNQYKVIAGLTPATSYYVELYSGSALRGYNTYVTKAPFSGEIIDLRGISNRPSVLQDTLAFATSGSTIIVKKGFVYTINQNVNFSKTVTIMSGDDLLIQEPAQILLTGNLNFQAGASIDSISFVNVHLKGVDPTGSYIFNPNTNANINKLKFSNCKIEQVRGGIRLRGTVVLNNLEINNCSIDSIGNYGFIRIESATSSIENISIKNSTVSKADFLIRSASNTRSILLESCTFFKTTTNNGYFIDYGSTNVTSGVIVSNCIFGKGRGDGSPSTRGIRIAGGTTAVSSSGSYTTSDYVDGGFGIPGITKYTRSSIELFTAPLTGDFKIKDNTFPGRSTAGDPKWRL